MGFERLLGCVFPCEFIDIPWLGGPVLPRIAVCHSNLAAIVLHLRILFHQLTKVPGIGWSSVSLPFDCHQRDQAYWPSCFFHSLAERCFSSMPYAGLRTTFKAKNLAQLLRHCSFGLREATLWPSPYSPIHKEFIAQLICEMQILYKL